GIATGNFFSSITSGDFKLDPATGALTQVLLTNPVYSFTTGLGQEHLVITSQPPASVLAGAPFDVQVTVIDPDGNVDTAFAGAGTSALGANPGGGTLGGTVTVPAMDGVADFGDLTLDRPGKGYTLQAISPTGGFATTSPFDVQDQLVVTAQPPASV